MIPEAGTSERAARALILAAVFGAAAAVALLSTGRGTPVRAGPSADPPVPARVGDGTVMPAASYDELLARRSVGHDFTEVLTSLPASGGKPLGPRSSRRAFVGAPPVIPHAVDPRGSSGCRACHDTGMAFPNGVQAPRMSHEPLTVCTQCHVPDSPGLTLPEDTRE